MATYIPGVKDYIPKLKPFTPNYKFLQDVLEVRQDRYTSNFKALNNLYNQVVNADLSIDANRKTRDSYAKNLSEKLKQVSGKDLSLQGNVEQAKALFRPFYEDDKILYDMGYTASVKKQMQEAEKLRYSNDEKQREMYWNDGMQRLQWHLEDFSKKTPEEALSVPIPKYVPHVNVVDIGIEKLKEMTGNKDISSWEMTDQGLEITTTNGTAITADVVGYERDSDGKLIKQNGKLIPITKNRAADYLNQTLLKDPRIQDYYATKAYVEGRNWWSNPENIKLHGNEQEAKKWWLQDVVRQSVDQQIQQIVSLDSEIQNLEGTSDNWRSYMEKTGIVPGTGEYQYYQGILDQLQLLEQTKRSTAQGVRELKSPVETMRQLEGLAYKGIAMGHISRDIANASTMYAQIGKKTEVKFNEREKLLMQHRHKLREQAHKAWLDESLAKKKGELGGGGQPWNPFAGAQVDEYNYPSIDWENIDPNSKEAKALDNVYWDSMQEQGISKLAQATTDAKIKTILDAYNNKDTGFAKNNNLSGQPGQITYSRQNPIVKSATEMYEGMDGVMTEEIIAAANDLEKEQVSTNLADFQRYMQMPENSDELDRLYSKVFEDTSQFDVQPVDFNGRMINAYVWKNQNAADNPAFSQQMVENQLQVEGLTAVTNTASEEFDKTKFNIANILPGKVPFSKGMIPLAMYEHELALLNGGQRITWEQILAKRKKDEQEGKDFKNARIVGLDKSAYIENYVNYYKNLAPSVEDRDKLTTNDMSKNYPYWGVKASTSYNLSPSLGGYEFRKPVIGPPTFDEAKATKDAEEVYDKLRFHTNRLAMDPDANWGGGLPTFDVGAFTAGMPQLGSGAKSGYVYTFDYDAWDLKKGKGDAKMAVPHIQALRKATANPANYIVKVGDQSYTFDEEDIDEETDLFVSDPEAQNVLDLWKQSLPYDPKTNSDARRAQFALKYIPEGAGGKQGNNEYAAYELSWSTEVANKLFSKSKEATSQSKQGTAGTVPQDSDFWETNSIMVFVKRDLDENPLARIGEQQGDYINAIMNHNGHFTASVPNGGSVTYRKSPEGTMVDLKTYRFDEESGNVILSTDYTKVAGVSNKQLQGNLFYNLGVLTSIANGTIQSKNQYKKSASSPVQNQ